MTRSSAKGYAENSITKTILDTLKIIAAEVQATSGQVALALTKSNDQIEQLNNFSTVQLGYPHEFA